MFLVCDLSLLPGQFSSRRSGSRVRISHPGLLYLTRIRLLDRVGTCWTEESGNLRAMWCGTYTASLLGGIFPSLMC